MRCVHFEDVKGRSEHELVFVRDEQRLKAVDELSDIRHRYLISVPMKRVQVQTRQHCIADGRLLTQEVRVVRLCAGLIPGAPFIDDQLDAMLPVNFALIDSDR
jgi:hypothetical protein